MQLTESELDNLSALARIDIKDNEKQKMLLDMQAILGYVSEINSVNEERRTKNEERSNTIFNITREDVVTHDTESNTKALLDNAPATEDGYVKVEQVMK